MRIWERESGALHAVGENAPGLLGKLAWQPNGRNLYAACRQPDGALRVLLFETNGLQHGGFDVQGKGMLPLSSHLYSCSSASCPMVVWKLQHCNAGTIVDLKWSPDSEFLAIVLSSGGDKADLKEVK